MAEIPAGTAVDGRYRILGRIGSGGMADVYSAHDEHLGREIALKVLHRRFAEDAEFVERFRREASAAAGLQHPNVVNVFDRGRYDGTYYIAMERLAGRSLKEVIEAEAPMNQERAVDLAIQILRAAGFAHRRGIIHRDLKPHNAIVSSDDRLKVTDFGIARAGASDMTEEGSVMGTAQYLSPEQAQGQSVTPSTDLYSVGVILYEMLTGRLPFDGDSAVSIALRHLSEPPPPLASVRPDVSPSLAAVVARALGKQPEERFPDADAFVAALEDARAAVVAGERPGSDTAEFAALPPTEVTAVAPPTVASGLGPPPTVPPPEDDEPAPRRRRALFPLLLLLLVLGGLAIWLVAQGGGKEVPAVVDQRYDMARAELQRAGFRVERHDVRNDAPAQTVVDQDPEGGARADEGSTVTLDVSLGPALRTVPDVSGRSKTLAIRILNRERFKVSDQEQHSTDVPEGRAIRTIPAAGERVQAGTRVRLLVSSGPRQLKVPDVVGLSQGSAESRLEGDGFDVALEEQESDKPVGEVVAQDPAAGSEAGEGSRVTITVSKAPDRAEVPDVEGLAASAAAAELRGAGFGVARAETPVDDPGQRGIVQRQSPGGGSQQKKGRTVKIYVGRYQAAEPPPVDGQTPP